VTNQVFIVFRPRNGIGYEWGTKETFQELPDAICGCGFLINLNYPLWVLRRQMV
jgi:hypothetical protein